MHGGTSASIVFPTVLMTTPAKGTDMADERAPLTDEERAELEALRAEKAAFEARERAERERAELEALRKERARSSEQAAQARSRERRTQELREEDQRIREARERGARLMEPGDDLRMPTGRRGRRAGR